MYLFFLTINKMAYLNPFKASERYGLIDKKQETKPINQ